MSLNRRPKTENRLKRDSLTPRGYPRGTSFQTAGKSSLQYSLMAPGASPYLPENISVKKSFAWVTILAWVWHTRNRTKKLPQNIS